METIKETIKSQLHRVITVKGNMKVWSKSSIHPTIKAYSHICEYDMTHVIHSDERSIFRAMQG